MHFSPFEAVKLTYRIVLKRFFLFAVPVLVLFGLGLSLLYRNQYNAIIFDIEKEQESIVRLSNLQLRSLIDGIYDDLNIVLNSDEFSVYLETPGAETRDEINSMFIRFLRSKPSYTKLRFLSSAGSEIIKIQRDGERIIAAGHESLQKENEKYYITSLRDIESGDLYVSDLDLNYNKDLPVHPYEITVRFAIPVYYKQERRGFLMVNFNGQKLLEILTEFEKTDRDRITMGLLSGQGLISFSLLENRDSLGDAILRGRSGSSAELFKKFGNTKSGHLQWEGINYFFKNVEPSVKFRTRFDGLSGNWYLVSSYRQNLIRSESENFLIRNRWLNPLILFVLGVILLIFIFFYSIRESEHFFLVATGYISDFSHDGIIITDANMDLIYCNKVFEETFGFSFNQIKGKKPHNFLRGESQIKFSGKNSGSSIWEGNVWDVTSEYVHVQKFLRVKTVSSPQKGIIFYIGIYSEPKTILNSIDQDENSSSFISVNNDSLSCVCPNFDFINRKEDSGVAIILRIVNMGEIIPYLCEEDESSYIHRLSTLLRSILSGSGHIVAPMAGLFVLTDYIENPSGIDSLMLRIENCLGSFRFLQSTPPAMEYISGISFAPDHGRDGHELIKNAFVALEALSRMKSVKYLVFNLNIFEEVKQVRMIRNEVTKAFTNDEFHVVYQMQNDVQTRAPIGMEALVRWNSASLGPISPGLFVPVMEENQQIKRLGRHILHKVLDECRRILPSAPENFKISVNLSSQEFNDSQLVAELVQMVNESQVPAESICFEITETILSENLKHTSSTIEFLHKNGLTVAIDDFGTGYSSLSYLKHLQSDKLKIDRTFIMDFPSRDDGSILKAISDLAHQMGVRVIVEGIETREQLEYVRTLHCEEFQGFLESRPVGIDQIHSKLEAFHRL